MASCWARGAWGLGMAETAAQTALAAPHGIDLTVVVVMLAAAVVAVPLFRRAGLGSVLGYLAAGLAIGPHGLGLFQDAQAVIRLAELGVVLFLFVIGLEMRPDRLWSMRGEIFGLGLVYMLVGIAALICVGLALGYPVAASFVAASGFVMSSTAICMQLLAERGQAALPRGRRMFSILLLEDLAIVPLLAIVAFMAPGGDEATWADRLRDIGIGLAAIAVLVLAGRYLLDPMFRLLARFGAREVMTAAALLVVLGAAMLMQAGGLSMAMGAFLAGVLLSESRFRFQLEADVEPFRGLLLGLFFLGVGMALDLGVIARNLGLILVAVPAFLGLKMLVLFAVARLFRASRAEALERAVIMAQGGEFAFVLYGTAVQFGILRAEWNAILTAIVIISMILTPVMILLHDRFAARQVAAPDGLPAPEAVAGSVLIVGYGRMGQIISQPLLERGYGLTIIDNDPQAIRDAGERGFKIWYGDGGRPEILKAAGAERARLIIAAAGDRDSVTRIAEHARENCPDVPVLARAFDRDHARELLEAGVAWPLHETLESALAMGHEALIRLGEAPPSADALIADIRRRDTGETATQ